MAGLRAKCGSFGLLCLSCSILLLALWPPASLLVFMYSSSWSFSSLIFYLFLRLVCCTVTESLSSAGYHNASFAPFRFFAITFPTFFASMSALLFGKNCLVLLRISCVTFLISFPALDPEVLFFLVLWHDTTCLHFPLLLFLALSFFLPHFSNVVKNLMFRVSSLSERRPKKFRHGAWRRRHSKAWKIWNAAIH